MMQSIRAIIAGMALGVLATIALPAARALSDAELARITGGSISTCQTTAEGNPVGWFCNGTGTFSCTTTCEACDFQSESTCTDYARWWCGVKGNDDDIKVRECFKAVVNKGQTCTDMGSGVTPCPTIRREQCIWDDSKSMCIFNSNIIQTNEPCPRANCQ